MVTTVTSFGRSGLADWLIQRVSAVVLAAYTFFIVFWLVFNPDVTYAQWSQLFSHMWMRVFTLILLLSLVAHGWIGLWVVLTDYVTARFMGGSAVVLRMLAMGFYALVSLIVLVWGIEIIWGL